MISLRRSARLRERHINDTSLTDQKLVERFESDVKDATAKTIPQKRKRNSIQPSGKPVRESKSRKRKRAEEVTTKARKEEEEKGKEIGNHLPPNKRPELNKSKGEVQHKQTRDPVEYWASCGDWPSDYAEMQREKSSTPSKRRRSSASYSQSARKGEVPQAHTVSAVERLLLHGINLEGAAAEKYIKDKDLCEEMLGGIHDFVPSAPFPLSKLTLVLDRVSLRNEARVVRDVSPLIIPSAESLVFSEYIDSKYIVEEIAQDWKQLNTMGGPMPRPDITVGIGRGAFNSDEFRKLQNYKSWEHATMFTDWVYFPFFICEVKCSEVAISRAARQSAHAAGMAANAIFQLVRTLGEEEAMALNGRILVFSMAHDHRSAVIYGIFPYIHSPGAPPVFYRYTVISVTFDKDAEKHMKSIRDFVIGIFKSFYSVHLTRIKGVLEKTSLPETPPPGQEEKATATDSELMPPPTASASQFQEQLAQKLQQFEQLQQEQLAQKLQQFEQLQQQLEAQKEEARIEKEKAEREIEVQRERAEKEREAQRERAEAQRERAEKEREAERERAEKEREAQKEEHRQLMERLESLLKSTTAAIT